jgi:Transglycosylase SLT domain
MRSGKWLGLVSFAALSVMIQPPAEAAKARPTLQTIKRLLGSKTAYVQIVTFPDTAWSPIRVVRGEAMARSAGLSGEAATKAETAEIVSFGDADSKAVRVLRGESDRASTPSAQPPRGGSMTSQLVAFANPRFRPVTVFRGATTQSTSGIDFFAPAREPDLDRVAFAVDGAESSHGADLRMWRPEPDGPQGPMQVSAAAAADIGGGDRFDFNENRQLGRAYLARLYRRYGNWPDAIAAYNWGPGNMDSWIAAGRPTAYLPLDVEHYRNRVLREVGFDRAPSRAVLQPAPQFIDFAPATEW